MRAELDCTSLPFPPPVPRSFKLPGDHPTSNVDMCVPCMGRVNYIMIVMALSAACVCGAW